MHIPSSSEIADIAEKRVVKQQETSQKIRLLFGFDDDWLHEWLHEELPDLDPLPDKQEARECFELLPEDRRECMRQRAIRIATKFNKTEPWLEVTLWDALVILLCFDFDEEKLKAYVRDAVTAEEETARRLQRAAEAAR